MLYVPITEPRIQNKMVLLKSFEAIGKISTYQTGCFPVTTIRGSKYLMFLFDHDSDVIIEEPLKLWASTNSFVHTPPSTLTYSTVG